MSTPLTLLCDNKPVGYPSVAPAAPFRLISADVTAQLIKTVDIQSEVKSFELLDGIPGEALVRHGQLVDTIGVDLLTVHSHDVGAIVDDVKNDFTRTSLILFSTSSDPLTRTATFVDMTSFKRLYTVTLDPKSWNGTGIGDRAVIAPNVLRKCLVTIFRQDRAQEEQVGGKGKGKCYSALGSVGTLSLLLANHERDLYVLEADDTLRVLGCAFPRAHGITMISASGATRIVVKIENRRNLFQWLAQRPMKGTLSVVDLAAMKIKFVTHGAVSFTGAISPDGTRLAVLEEGSFSIFPLM